MSQPQGPNGQQMVPVPPQRLSPHEEKINLSFIVLERAKAGEGEDEVIALRNAAAKCIRDHIEAPIDTRFENIWTPQVAKA